MKPQEINLYAAPKILKLLQKTPEAMFVTDHIKMFEKSPNQFAKDKFYPNL